MHTEAPHGVAGCPPCQAPAAAAAAAAKQKLNLTRPGWPVRLALGSPRVGSVGEALRGGRKPPLSRSSTAPSGPACASGASLPSLGIPGAAGIGGHCSRDQCAAVAAAVAARACAGCLSAMLDDPAAEVRVVAQGLVMAVELAAACYETAGNWSSWAAVGCGLAEGEAVWSCGSGVRSETSALHVCRAAVEPSLKRQRTAEDGRAAEGGSSGGPAASPPPVAAAPRLQLSPALDAWEAAAEQRPSAAHAPPSPDQGRWAPGTCCVGRAAHVPAPRKDCWPVGFALQAIVSMFIHLLNECTLLPCREPCDYRGQRSCGPAAGGLSEHHTQPTGW